jgi:hypothetical protein
MKRSLKAVITTLPLAAIFLGASGLPADAIAGKQVKNTTRTSVNKNTNVNRNTNTNVNRNTNVNVNSNRHVDVDVDVDRGFHPIGTVVAVGAAVVVTSAIVGSTVNSVPPSCVPVQVGAVLYQQCGSTWYQPQYAGTTVQYVVINPPR